MKNFICMMILLVLGFFIYGTGFKSPSEIRDANETEFESMLDWLVEDHPNIYCRAEALESFPRIQKAGEMTARIRLLESRIHQHNQNAGIRGTLALKRDVALLKHEVKMLKDSVKTRLNELLSTDAIYCESQKKP